jgi:hypothetical protein
MVKRVDRNNQDFIDAATCGNFLGAGRGREAELKHDLESELQELDRIKSEIVSLDDDAKSVSAEPLEAESIFAIRTASNEAVFTIREAGTEREVHGKALRTYYLTENPDRPIVPPNPLVAYSVLFTVTAIEGVLNGTFFLSSGAMPYPETSVLAGFGTAGIGTLTMTLAGYWVGRYFDFQGRSERQRRWAPRARSLARFFLLPWVALYAGLIWTNAVIRAKGFEDFATNFFDVVGTLDHGLALPLIALTVGAGVISFFTGLFGFDRPPGYRDVYEAAIKAPNKKASRASRVGQSAIIRVSEDGSRQLEEHRADLVSMRAELTDVRAAYALQLERVVRLVGAARDVLRQWYGEALAIDDAINIAPEARSARDWRPDYAGIDALVPTWCPSEATDFAQQFQRLERAGSTIEQQARLALQGVSQAYEEYLELSSDKGGKHGTPSPQNVLPFPAS